MLVCTSWGIWLMLQCSIPPLYCHDYDTNSVKWLHSVIKPTQSMEDERTPSPFDLVFFNRMFSFIFSFIRKCSKLFFFFLTANVLTDKTFFGKSFLVSAWRLCVCRKHVEHVEVWWVRAHWGLCKEMNWFFKGQGWSCRAVKALS